MRSVLQWLFAALVLANVGVVMWANWYQQPAVPSPTRPLPEVHPERMALLSQGQVKRTVSAPVRAKPLRPAPPAHVVARPVVVAPDHVAPASPPERRCVTIGPFEVAADAQRAGKELQRAHIDYADRTKTDRVPQSYWVYLPAPSHAAAVRMLRVLDRKGIRQHIIMRQPGLENAISLGLYDKPANAQDRLDGLAKKGVHARQRIRYRTRTRYWLDAEVRSLGESERLPGWNWGAPGVVARDVSCAPPASVKSQAAARHRPASQGAPAGDHAPVPTGRGSLPPGNTGR